MTWDSYIHKVLPGEPGGPMLFMFHGTGGDEDQFAAFGREISATATVVAPRGDVSEYGAARFFRRTGEGVYDMEDLARASTKAAAFVKAHVEMNRPSAVLGLGYSNGANILASTLFAAPQLLDAAVLMHPLIPFEPQVAGSLAGKRVLLTAGRRDPICPASLTLRLEAYLRDEGANVTVEWHDGGHELRPNEIAAARRFLGSGPSIGG